MKITYIGHSGFFVKLDNLYMLFDYFEGDIPLMKLDKSLIVFVSHNHHDHFNPAIFGIQHSKIIYVLSYDVKLVDKPKDKKIVIMNEHEKINLTIDDINSICIETLKSTDEGIAFLIQTDGKTIYHAGDLNLWKWLEEDDNYNQTMAINYSKEIDLLKDKKIDVAFLPLDPRQEKYEFEGIEEFIQKISVKTIFPMHFWKDYTIIQRFNDTHEKKVNVIERMNQTFDI